MVLSGKSFEELVEIMAALRGPNGCPWDIEQDHDSLKPYILEEAYEVLETIDNKDFTSLKEELGDLLLQTVFHAQVAKENGHFDIDDVLKTLSNKLVTRHPHVFGEVEINSAEDQIVHWEKIKRKEGKKSAIDGVPKDAPALLRAQRVQQKAATVGFDWDKRDQVLKKVSEEIKELEVEIDQKNEEGIEEEFGDLLFALVNYARFVHVNAEDALRKSIDKFSSRFKKVEARIREQGKTMQESTLAEMDAVWNEIKKV